MTAATRAVAPATTAAGDHEVEVGLPRPTIERGPWFLVVLHLPFIAAGPAIALPRHDVPPLGVVLTVAIATAIGALQLRHSFSASRGERPAGAVVTFLLLTALVYAPLWWYSWDWAVMQWFVAASGAMVLRRWPVAAAVVAVGPTVGTTVLTAWLAAGEPGVGPGLLVAATVYQFTLQAMGAAALYGSAWLVRVLDDLSAARTELAELAVGRERLRVSRDLHDLLGQTLSAVSLKGDLALRLLPTDTAAAGAEIASLTGVARDALRDVRAVARDEHGVSLAAELDAAVTLLSAAGIVTEVDVELPELSDLPRPVEEVLAWAVREGATNALRHSGAARWTAVAGTAGHAGAVTLEIVNDGVAERGARGDGAHGDGTGTGLPGLVERARGVAGTVTAGPVDGGRFRLRVEVPREAP